jgi:hypothetical protein
MKSILLTLPFIFLVFIKSYSQQVTYKDLIGTKWIDKMKMYPPKDGVCILSYEFIDSSNCIAVSIMPFKDSPPEIFTDKYSLSLNNGFTLLSLTNITPVKINVYFAAKFVGKNIIGIQSIYDTSNVCWDDNSLTFILTKSD